MTRRSHAQGEHAARLAEGLPNDEPGSHLASQVQAGEQAPNGKGEHNGHIVPLVSPPLRSPSNGTPIDHVNGDVRVNGNGVAGAAAHTALNGHVKQNGHAHTNGHGHRNGHAQPGIGTTPIRIVQPRSGRYDRYVKPAVDWLGGLMLFVFFLPVMLAVAIAVWVSLGSPVLIRQRRVGRDGREFGMFKFRTMHPDRRQRRVELPPEADRRRIHKSADDPRHTPLGRFLRRMSLDELPQLLNVLAGHMSLVGPRPELADIVASVYEPWQLQRHLVKPGITGLWQVTERFEGNGVMHHHTVLDLTYIEQLSFRTDLRILLRTPIAVVGTKRTE